MQIDILRPQHLSQLIDFFQEISAPNYRQYFSPHPCDLETANTICRYQGNDAYFGAFSDEKQTQMIGYGILRGLDAGYEIPSLGVCVDEAFQGSGIGRALMKTLLEACKTRNVEIAMLKARDTNLVALKLYRSIGFEFTKKQDDYLIGYISIEDFQEG
jgi:ribosomal protein S18 acetylase RimI-like enzyme